MEKKHLYNWKYKIVLNIDILELKKWDEFTIYRWDGYFEPDIVTIPDNYNLSQLIDVVWLEENLFTITLLK